MAPFRSQGVRGNDARPVPKGATVPDNDAYETKIVRNRTRRVMFWLMIAMLVFGGSCSAMAASAATEQDTLDARCEQADIFADGEEWAEACGESVGNTLGTGLAVTMAVGWFVLAVVFFLIFVTRDKHKPQIVPSD